ncbi:MAG: hypothetical protein AB7F40_06955 [Victivallaceae bacterium]|nr:hypothetical protein [Victivallaceae bacterium]
MRRFTLVEVIAVTVIMAMLAAVAVATLRDTPPNLAMGKAVDGFALLCGQARVRAMETGTDCSVVFGGERRFYAAQDGKELGFEWSIPDKFGFDPGKAEAGEELFRFFPDGGAAGNATLILKYEDLARKLYISPLTGMLEADDEAE